MFTLISIYSDIFSILQGAPPPVAPVAVCWWLSGDPVSADAPGLWVSLEHPPAWSQAWAAAWEGKLGQKTQKYNCSPRRREEQVRGED